MTLSLELLQGELAKVKHRPGWRFRLYQHPFRGVMLVVYANVTDSNTGEPLTIGPRFNVPTIAQRSFGDFHLWMVDLLVHMDTHETVEFYRVNGVPLFDPHGEGWAELGDPEVVS
jgi:hypothetical protein